VRCNDRLAESETTVASGNLGVSESVKAVRFKLFKQSLE